MKNGRYPDPDVPADDAWKQMQDLMQAQPPADIGMAQKGLLRKILGFGSASLIVVTALFFLMRKSDASLPPLVISHTSQSRPVRIMLPDSMIAYLNTYSRLVLPADVHTNEAVQLYGSAYFDAVGSHDGGKAITAGTLRILPSNAAFYVTYDSAYDHSTVHVSSGKVELITSKGSYQLVAGESTTYHGRTGETEATRKADINLYGYATLVFEFSDTPLADAIAALENAYGYRIILANEKMRRCRITTRFDHKTLREILDIMAYTLNFTFTMNEQARTVSLKGEGCE